MQQSLSSMKNPSYSPPSSWAELSRSDAAWSLRFVWQGLLLFLFILLLAPIAQAQTPARVYEFNGSFADSMGGPAMVPNGGTLGSTTYTFAAGQGPNVSNVLTNTGEYTIEMLFTFTDNLNTAPLYKAILNFGNVSIDPALYVQSGSMALYNYATSTTVDMATGQQHRVVMTRNASTKTCVVYVDGAAKLTVTDTNNSYVASGPGGILHFFRDNLSENSAGAVDQIRIYNTVLTSTQVAGLTNSDPTNIALSVSSIAENNLPNATVGVLSTTDPNAGNTFTYTLASGGVDNASFTLSGSTLRLTPSANFEAKNSYSVRIRSTDQGGLFFEKIFTVNITNINESPSFTKGANQLHILGTTAAQSFTGWATTIDDGDATVTQALNFNVSVVSGGSIFTTAPSVSSNGTLSYTLSGTTGNATINLSLTDDNTAGGAALTTATQTFTIAVVPNTAPTISDVADRAINEDATTGALAVTIGDTETAATSLTLSGSSSNNTLVPNANIVFGGSGTARTVVVTPVSNLSGTATITLTVSDGTTSSNDTFVLTVNPANDAPSFALTGIPAGATWTARATNRPWISITSSADGTKLAAAAYNGHIQTSTDSGVTWTPRHTPYAWYSITSSADGTKLAAVATIGQIHTSTDSGVSWTLRETNREWYSITSSSDGSKLAAVVNNGQIYTSTNSGVSWTARNSSRTWQSITSSADGSKLAAVVRNGQIYTSADSGVSWTARDSNRFWYSITSSADGSKLAAVVQGGQIYTSSDSGVTWTPRDSNRSWHSVTSSADGSKLAAVVAPGGRIYTSIDSGLSWTARETNRSWISIASSSDGGKLAAAENNGRLYTSSINDFSVGINSGLSSTPSVVTSISPGPTDETGQTVAFNVANNNNALFSVQPAIAADGTLTFTPGSVIGTAIVSVTAQDNGGTANGGTATSAVQTFTITVTNNAPTINDVANQSISEDAATSALAITIGDTETAAASLSLSGSSSNTSLVPDTNIVFGGSGTARTVVVTPAPNQSGISTITLTVSDGTTTNTDTFVLTVNPVNDMPVFTKGPDKTHPFGTDAAQSFSGWATGIDDGDANVTQALMFNITVVNGGSIFTTPPTVSNTGTLSYTPNGNPGTATINVSLTDDATAGGAALTSATQTFTVTTGVATFNSATDIPVTAVGYSATGKTINFALSYAPLGGTTLTVVKNTSLSFITGTFSNLAQGQAVALNYGGATYNFVANYFGGSGNDLVLHWADTRATAWGYNYYGQLGNNTKINGLLPGNVLSTGVLSGKTVIAVSGGNNHSLALCSDGTLASWGLNAVGELGNNSNTDSLVPVLVNTSGALSGKTVIAIAAGVRHSLALCSDGTLVAWGFNGFGELGINNNTNSSVPVAVTTSGALSGKSVVAISAGVYFSAALCSDGTVATWGTNSEGQLGNGTTTFSLVPVAVTTSGLLSGKTVISLSTGYSHCLALCSDGTLASWGWNINGQLGINSTTRSLAPVAVDTSGVLSGKTVLAVSAAGTNSLVLCSDGTLASWGKNTNGELGNNSTINSPVPVAVTTSGFLSGKTVIDVKMGGGHSLALCADGTLATWGDNSTGQLGINSTTKSLVPVAVSTSTFPAGDRFVSAFSGPSTYHTLALVASPPPPTITGISPSSGTTNGGTGVTITGMSLSGATSVTIGGTTATIGTITDTAITATTPAHAAGVVDVVVTTPYGSGTGANLYTFIVPTPGDLDPLNANIVGTLVLATAVQPDGKIIIGGTFSQVLGAARQNIARINANGTLDTTFNPKANGSVTCLAVQSDGKILLGGNFTSLQPNGVVSATTRNRVARVNSDGTLDTTFNPNANSIVSTLALQTDGKVLLGGLFNTIQPNGAASATTRNRVARLNASGTLDTTFNPNASDEVRSLVVQADGKVLLGGVFNTLQPSGAASPISRNRVARVNADGTLDTTFDPNAGGTVNNVAIQADGKVLLGGLFTTLQPNGAASATTRNRVARVNSDGVLDDTFDPNANSAVTSMAVQADGKVLLGGLFSALQPNGASSPTTRQYAGRVNSDGTLDTLILNVNNEVYSVSLQADGMILMGGFFSSLLPGGSPDPIPRNFFARIANDAATRTISTPDTTQVVWSLSGSTPDLSAVSFENSTNGGSTWTFLPGTVSRMGVSSNWTLTGTGLPTSGHLRLRGRSSGGYANGSTGIIEQISAFTAPPVPPTVNSISPSNGISAGGTTVTITGTGLFGATSVSIGGAAATSFTVVNGTTITAVTSARAIGTASVLVTGPGGTNVPNSLFTFTNSPPTISNVANSSTDEDSSTDDIIISIGDVDTLSGSLIVTASSSNTTLVPNGNLSLGGTGSTRTLVVTPVANLTGTTTITLTVTDAGALTATDTFVLTVNAVNDMPSFVKGGNQTHPFGTTAAQTVAGWASSISDGDPQVTQSLTFNVSVVSGSSLFAVSPSVSSTGTLSYTLNGIVGTAEINVSLTDNAAAGGPALTTEVQNFTITMLNPIAPGAPIIGSATAGNSSATVTFTAPVIDGGSLINGYTVVSSPGGFTGTGSVSPITVSGLINGTAYTFTVTATNSYGTSVASAASNSVTPLPAPTIDSVSPNFGPLTGGTAVTITGTNFVSPATVTFGGVNATSVIVVNSSTITAVSPASAPATASVLVSTLGGITPDNTLFAYVAPTSTTLVSSLSGTGFLTPPTFTAQATSPHPGISGQMDLFIDDVLLESKSVDATGKASFTPLPAALPVGSRTIRAVFNQNQIVAAYAASSATITQVVVKNFFTPIFSDLEHGYDGNSKSAKATINVPSTHTSVKIDLTYSINGIPTPPVNAGNYVVEATVDDPSLTGYAWTSFTINKAAATFSVAAVPLVYDGTPKAPVLTTSPEGLPTTVRYQPIVNGVPAGSPSTAAPKLADRYLGTVATSSPNHSLTTTTFEFDIDKAVADVFFIGEDQIYDGTPRIPIYSVVPTDVPISFTYQRIVNGIPTGIISTPPPFGVGKYLVSASSPNHELSAEPPTLNVTKRPVSISIRGLDVVSDGQPKPVSVTTEPEGIPMTVTYTSGGITTATAPSGPPSVGDSWKVDVYPTDSASYSGAATGQLKMSARMQPSLTLAGPAAITTASASEFTATVGFNGREKPTGSVLFKTAENVSLFSGRVGADGVVRAKITDLKLRARPEPHSLIAVYEGDSNYNSATSNTHSTTVTRGIAEYSPYTLSYDYTGKPLDISKSHLRFLKNYPNFVNSYNITYNGSSTAPTNVSGSPIEVKVTYQTTFYADIRETIMVTMNPDYVQVRVTELQQTLVPGGNRVKVITDPPGLESKVTVTYNGAILPNGPTTAGEYSVQAFLNDSNYRLYNEVDASGNLVLTQTIVEFITDGLNQNYDGRPKELSIKTKPDIPYIVEYKGSTKPPTAPGIYEVKITPQNTTIYGLGTTRTMYINAEVLATVNGQPNATNLKLRSKSGSFTSFPAFCSPHQNEWELRFEDTNELTFKQWSDGSKENPRKLSLGRPNDPASFTYNAEAKQNTFIEAKTVVSNLPQGAGGTGLGKGYYAEGEMAKFEAGVYGKAIINHWEYAGKPLNPNDGHIIRNDGRLIYIKVKAGGGNPVCHITQGYLAEGWVSHGAVQIKRTDNVDLPVLAQRYVPFGVNFVTTATPVSGYIFHRWESFESAQLADSNKRLSWQGINPYNKPTNSEEIEKLGTEYYSGAYPKFIKDGPEFTANYGIHKRVEIPWKLFGASTAKLSLTNTGRLTKNVKLKSILATGFCHLPNGYRGGGETYYYPYERNQAEKDLNKYSPMNPVLATSLFLLQPVGLASIDRFNFFNENFVNNIFSNPLTLNYIVGDIKLDETKSIDVNFGRLLNEVPTIISPAEIWVEMTAVFSTDDGDQWVHGWWMDLIPEDPN